MSFFSQKMASEQLAWLPPQWSTPQERWVPSGHRGAGYTCFSQVLLSWSLSRHLSCVLTVALSCEEGIIKQLIKEGHIISQVKGTQMYCQEPGREMVGLGPLLGGLSIMRVRQLCMIIFLLCNRCDLYRFLISENLNIEVLYQNFFLFLFPSYLLPSLSFQS